MKHDIWLSIDFDGVVSTYDGWKGFDVLGQPIPEVRECLKACREKGYKIVIFTTRLDTPTLRAWLKEHDIPYNSINSTSHNPPHTSTKPISHVIIDDRAIRYQGQSSNVLLEQIEMLLNKEL